MSAHSREWSFEPPVGIADRETGLNAILKKLRYDLDSCQARLSEAIEMVATLNLPENAGDRVKCPSCSISLAGPNTLAEHLYHYHDGPEPEHWTRIEALSQDPEYERSSS